jgi:hypothetical protein
VKGCQGKTKRDIPRSQTPVWECTLAKLLFIPRSQTPVWERTLAKLLFRVRFRDGRRNRSFADGVPKREFGNKQNLETSEIQQGRANERHAVAAVDCIHRRSLTRHFPFSWPAQAPPPDATLAVPSRLRNMEVHHVETTIRRVPQAADDRRRGPAFHLAFPSSSLNGPPCRGRPDPWRCGARAS